MARACEGSAARGKTSGAEQKASASLGYSDRCKSVVATAHQAIMVSVYHVYSRTRALRFAPGELLHTAYENNSVLHGQIGIAVPAPGVGDKFRRAVWQAGVTPHHAQIH